MTTTAPKNTRVSDLNKLIEAIDAYKENNPHLDVPEGDPEAVFITLCASAYFHKIMEAGCPKEPLATSYLWIFAGLVLGAVNEQAALWGVEDLSILDRYLAAIPAYVADLCAQRLGKQIADEDSLFNYGNTIISDFFTKEDS